MNNINIYLFGVLKNGYVQSVDDYTRPILEEFVRETKAPTQLFVRRKDQLIYYGYVRRLDAAGRYLGLCVEANDWLITHLPKLFSIFESAVEQILLEGKIVALDDAMRTFPCVADFSGVSSEVEMTVSRVRGLFSSFPVDKGLPFASTNVAHDSIRKLSLDTSEEEVKASFVRNGLTIVFKHEDYEGEMLSKYRRQIEALQHNLERKSSEAAVLHQALIRSAQEVKNIEERQSQLKTEEQAMRVTMLLFLLRS